MADLDKFIKALRSLPSELKKVEKKVAKTLKQDLLKSIKQRMIDGQGLSAPEHGAALEPYKPLKESTIKKRKYLDRKNKLSPLTTPETSNQIATGKMLGQIRAESKGNEVTVGVKGSRQKVAQYQEAKGRPTFYVSQQEQEIIDDQVHNEIDKAIKNMIKNLG